MSTGLTIARNVDLQPTSPQRDAQDIPNALLARPEAALAHAAAHGQWSVNIGVYPMPRWKSVGIDDLDAFEYAQWLAQRHPEWAA